MKIDRLPCCDYRLNRSDKNKNISPIKVASCQRRQVPLGKSVLKDSTVLQIKIIETTASWLDFI